VFFFIFECYLWVGYLSKINDFSYVWAGLAGLNT